jgi:hypothetical protein
LTPEEPNEELLNAQLELQKFLGKSFFQDPNFPNIEVYTKWYEKNGPIISGDHYIMTNWEGIRTKHDGVITLNKEINGKFFVSIFKYSSIVEEFLKYSVLKCLGLKDKADSFSI